MFYALDVEALIRPDHPLRQIKKLVDEDLSRMGHLFNQAYSDTGRPSVPPERLLKALLLQALYTVRSESQLVERIATDLLFRWFLDMDPAEPAFDQTAFTHNRPRLDKFGITQAFFGSTVRRIQKEKLASDEHFTFDGTMIDAYASIKSFVPREQVGKEDSGDSNGFKSRNPEVDFHGQKRSNDTHQSRTDPEARLYKKGNGQEARMRHLGHLITDNRHGLVLAVAVSSATGDAEPAQALQMLDDLKARHGMKPRTGGADKGYDSGPFMLELEKRDIIPHVAVKEGRIGGEHPEKRKDQEAIAARQRMRDRMKNLGYKLSQKTRKRCEEAIGWIKTIGGLARTRLVGHKKVQQQLEVCAAAYNYVRMIKLRAA
jgi:transposase